MEKPDKNGFPTSELVNSMNFVIAICNLCKVDHTKKMKFTAVYSKVRYQMDKATELVAGHRINLN